MNLRWYTNINVQSKYMFMEESIKVTDTENSTVFHYIPDSDRNVLPEKLKATRIYDIRIRLLETWITKNIFIYMVAHPDNPETKTTDIRLRIAISQINKLTSLPHDAKLYWIEWLCALYKARMRAKMDYYLKHIVQIPF